MNVLLKAATIIDKSSKYNGKTVDILIEKGIISKIAKSIPNPKKYKEITLDNLHVSVGWFDSSVSFGEPGFEERETIQNGLKTAALSGFTDVVLNANSQPVIDCHADVAFVKGRAAQHAVNLHVTGALTKNSEGVDLAELYDMKNAGAVAFGDYQKAIENPNLLKIALQYAQNFNGLICSYPQENKISGSGVVNEEKSSTYLGLKGNPALAEELQIVRDLFLLEYAGGALHIPTISTAKSVKLIKEAKKKGLNVSCSVAVHNLLLDDSALESFDSNLKTLPPLRTKNDCKTLIKGLLDNSIDMITSDHNPIDIEHKKVAFEQAMYGSLGLESAFSALNTTLDLETTIDVLTRGRKRFQVDMPSMTEGSLANICLFTPEGEGIFSENDIISTSKNSAFLGHTTKGAVYGVISNNQLIIK
jgi:dihydroorotase